MRLLSDSGPDGPKTKTTKIAGLAHLAGIGFTMAIFIAELAFKGDPFADSLITAKLGILAASLLAALIGMLLLLATAKSPEGQ